MNYDTEVMMSLVRPGLVAAQEATRLMAMAKKLTAQMAQNTRLGGVNDCPRDRDECYQRVIMSLRTMRRQASGRGAQNVRSNWDAIMRAAIFSLSCPAGSDEDARLIAEASRAPLDDDACDDDKLARAFNPSPRDVGDWLEASLWWSSLGTHPGETLIPGSPIGKNVSRGMVVLWLASAHDTMTDRYMSEILGCSAPTVRNWRGIAIDRMFAIAKTRYAERARAKR